MSALPSIRTSSRVAPPSVDTLLRHYEQMLLLRRFELAVQQLYKDGRLPGFIHLYVGEEAVAVGVCSQLRGDDWITSTHRGHGHALAKGVPARAVMAELYGKATGCCGGRGGSMHLYDPSAGLLGTNGFVGGGIPSAVGVGIGAKVRGTGQVGVAFFGDGAVNHAAFHESINLAAAQDAPVLFICENNLYATATPLASATRNTDIASRAAAYGLPGVAVDGNDVLAVADAARAAVERARKGGGPTLIEARTYRTVGHHEGDPLVGTYRTQAELDEWKKRDPLVRVREAIKSGYGDCPARLDEIDSRVEAAVRDAVEFAEASALPDPATVHDHVWGELSSDPLPASRNEPQTRTQTWLDAVRDGIAEEMRRNPHLIYLGEGTGERGGSFAHTKGLWQEFGAHRMIDTPICELGFTGAAAGAAATGCCAVSDLMFSDFLFEAATQIIQQAAKLHYMSNGRIRMPMVVRSGMGAIKNAGPHHSGTYYPLWAHCPGLYVAVPSTPADAKGLMKSALRAGGPTLIFEHKMLFASKGPVPVGDDYLVPFGQAAIVRPGIDLTLVSCGLLVHRCTEAAALLEGQGISCEVIDLRTIVPLDVQSVVQSLTKTHRLLVVDEAFSMCGIGAELAAAVMEQAFDELDAPVGRLHTEPVVHPFSPPLENAVVVTVERIVAAAKQVVEGRAPAPRRAKPGVRRGAAAGRAAIADAGKAAPPTSEKEASDEMSKRMSDFDAIAPAPLSEANGAVPLLLPNQDLTVTEATVLRWLKQVGDVLRRGDEVVEVETAKATMAVESPADGRLASIDAPEGAVVPMGGRLGVITPK